MMALLPFICDFLPQRSIRTSDLFDLEDYASPFAMRRQIYPQHYLHRKDNSSMIKSDKNTFQVSLDVQQFKPDELTVKSLDNNIIQVEGKHEERQDEHGYISRQFIRKYTLPKGHDVENITSNLSSDGILTIVSNKRKHRCDEREIPIKMTGPSKMLSNGTENHQTGKNEAEDLKNEKVKKIAEPQEKKTKFQKF